MEQEQLQQGIVPMSETYYSAHRETLKIKARARYKQRKIAMDAQVRGMILKRYENELKQARETGEISVSSPSSSIINVNRVIAMPSRDMKLSSFRKVREHYGLHVRVARTANGLF